MNGNGFGNVHPQIRMRGNCGGYQGRCVASICFSVESSDKKRAGGSPVHGGRRCWLGPTEEHHETSPPSLTRHSLRWHRSAPRHRRTAGGGIGKQYFNLLQSGAGRVRVRARRRQALHYG